MTRDKIIQALSNIRNAAMGEKDMTTDDFKEEYGLLWEAFELHTDAATIVSILYFGDSDILTIQKATYESESAIFCELTGLTGRNFVEPVNDFWRLTDDAREAIGMGVPIPPKPFQDCVAELRSVNPDDITSVWVGRLSAGLRLPANKALCDGVRRLDVLRLPIGQQVAFWTLAADFLQKGSLGIYDGGESEDCHYTRDAIGALVTLGLAATVIPGEDELIKYTLAPEAAGALFRDVENIVNYKPIARVASVIKSNDIGAKELYYPAEAQGEMDILRKLVSVDGYARAAKVLGRMGRPAAVLCLLWGPPGTGKTEICRQMARESGRDLIVADVARLTGKYMGESEKAYRTLFQSYNSIAKVAPNAPILLLNEADSVLSRRVEVERSIDKSENAISDVILQELESMTGILIATTNHTDSLDDAYDRRFLFKIEVGHPDVAARERIWRSNIPELTEMEAMVLAKEFRMSGGQINNVAAKRCMAEIYYDGDRGLEYIERLCESELALERKKKGYVKKIGF